MSTKKIQTVIRLESTIRKIHGLNDIDFYFFYHSKVSGHPRNNPMAGGSFLTVERLEDDESWTTVATDADWETR